MARSERYAAGWDQHATPVVCADPGPDHPRVYVLGCGFASLGAGGVTLSVRDDLLGDVAFRYVVEGPMPTGVCAQGEATGSVHLELTRACSSIYWQPAQSVVTTGTASVVFDA